jgi:hypothetical protein
MARTVAERFSEYSFSTGDVFDISGGRAIC